ncbi:MAG: hypothetical protein ACI8WB_000042 [Phenylobacterium sp.]|jgi:hypothetical protein
MIRLSKKGWNNVLIFSMLLMIMVFNGMHKKFNSTEPQNTQVSLLPENSLMLTLEYPNTTIERIGQGWRSNPPIDLTVQQLNEVMTAWQDQQLDWHVDDNEAKVMTKGKMPAHYVIAHLAGKDEGAVYAFYPELEDVWIHDQQQQRWLKAPLSLINTLIPEPLAQN